MVRYALVAALALAATGAAAQQPTALLQPGETLLQVQASGEARVSPDAAFVTVGVVSTGTTAKEATDANAATMQAVLAAVRKAGVSDRYLRTEQISVQPSFAQRSNGYGEDRSRIVGYQARNSVAVTVTRLTTAPEVISAAFAAGANSVDGPNLGTLNTQAGQGDARAAALANAKAEAEDYARGLGMRVARVLRVSETRSGIAPERFVTYDVVVTGSRAGGPPPPPPPPPPVPIAGGDLKRSATVYIDYALVPAG
jgi:uncharacterized protein